MQIEKWSEDPQEQQRLLSRAPLVTSPELMTNIKAIVDDVKARGDEAVRDYCERFDRVQLDRFRARDEDIEEAYRSLDPAMRKALETAIANISAFHKAQMPKGFALETMPGVRCEMTWRAIDRVGLYAPAGTAPLMSALLMAAIPAVVAGCRKIVLCMPVQKNGKANPIMLAAAKMCGVTEVYTLGGAYAIAAMAFGTQQVPKVDKILGPGNAYVTAAKQLVSLDPDGAAIDMPAGPSEVMVIAGPESRADWVAADLLAQAEHDTISQAVLLTTDAAFAKQVQAEVYAQTEKLPRKAIVEKSLQISRIILVQSMQEALDIANLYAPEHLIISAPDAANYVDQVRTAGSVFLGPYSCETAGDYASGTNHVLPTYGATRAYAGLSIYSYLRSMTVQELSENGLRTLAPTLVEMAEAEGLRAHATAVTIRTQDI